MLRVTFTRDVVVQEESVERSKFISEEGTYLSSYIYIHLKKEGRVIYSTSWGFDKREKKPNAITVDVVS